MRITLVSVLLIAAAAPAAAEEADGPAEEPTADIDLSLPAPFRGHRAAPFHWTLGAAARTSGEQASSTAGALAVRVHGEVGIAYEYGLFSSYAVTGAELRAQHEPGLAPLGLEHWAAVRPWEIGAFRLDLDHRLTVEGRPALTRRPDLLRRAYTQEHLGVEMTGVHWRGTHWGGHLMRIGEGFELTWQRDGGDQHRRFRTTSDWSLAGITRDPGDDSGIAILELMSLEAEGIDATSDAVVMNTLYVRFADVPIGPLPVRIDGAYGHGATGYTMLSSGDSSITIETEDLPLVSDIPVWRARIHGNAAGITAGVGASRSLFLTYDVDLALEERAAADLAAPLAGGRLELEAFAARTTLWTDATTHHRERTGGAALRYQRPLGDGWTAAAGIEAARSFYATLDDEATPTAAPAARFDLELRKQLTGGHDLRH